MVNLLKETLEILEKKNKKESDVMLVIGLLGDYFKDDEREVGCSWELFKKYANFSYDNGFGGNNIKTSLKVVGTDFQLERHEYDGSEWWEYKEMPKIDIELIYGEKDIKDMIGNDDEY